MENKLSNEFNSQEIKLEKINTIRITLVLNNKTLDIFEYTFTKISMTNTRKLNVLYPWKKYVFATIEKRINQLISPIKNNS